jgi:hypothetical protein
MVVFCWAAVRYIVSFVISVMLVSKACDMSQFMYHGIYASAVLECNRTDPVGNVAAQVGGGATSSVSISQNVHISGLGCLRYPTDTCFLVVVIDGCLKIGSV